TPKTVAEAEKEFRDLYTTLKKKHPGAVLAILRDGQKGYDPAKPNAVFSGWKDAYWSSHGPDGMLRERAETRGRVESHEVFMRHRSPLMRVDLKCIPAGSKILSARLLVVKVRDLKGHDALAKPTMWVVEPCNRQWNEDEVNAYQFAKDR